MLKLGGIKIVALVLFAAIPGLFLSCDLFSTAVVGPFAEAAAGDYDYLIAGDFQFVDGAAQSYVARLDKNGRRVRSFDPVVDGPIHALTTLDRGGETHVLIGGEFSTVDGVSVPGVALLRLDGTLVSGFAPDLGPAIGGAGARTIYDFYVVPERGTVVVGGLFDGAVAVGGTVVDTAYSNLAELRLSDGRAVTRFAPQVTGTVYDLAAAGSASGWRVFAAGDLVQAGGITAPFAAAIDGDGEVVARISDPAAFADAGLSERFNYVTPSGDDSDFFVSGNDDVILDGYELTAIAIGAGVPGAPGEFNPTGFQLSELDGFVNVVSQTPDGSLFFGGEFTMIDEFPLGAAVPQAFVAAYSEAGLDVNFPVTVDGPVYDAFFLPGPRLLIAGGFATSTSSNGNGPGYLVMIDESLAIDNGFSPDLGRSDAAAPAVRVIRPIPAFDGD